MNQSLSDDLFTLINSDGEAAGAGELGLLLYEQGTVCNDDFGYEAADAICVELGFGWATRWNNNSYRFAFRNNYDIKISQVRCDRDSWTSCTFKTGHNCGHNRDVLLECHTGKGWFLSRISKSFSGDIVINLIQKNTGGGGPTLKKSIPALKFPKST